MVPEVITLTCENCGYSITTFGTGIKFEKVLCASCYKKKLQAF